MEKLDPFFALGARVFLSLMFILAGVSKLTADPAGMMQYMEAGGVPGFLFWPTALFETVGGLAILVGFKTRPIAFLLAGFCLVTALMFHSNFADQVQMTMFLKNLAVAGGFLMLVRFGAGEYSLDNRA